MTEQPSNIAREAKSIYQSLKELIKTKEPFDKELEFQRKNLRKRYLNLLLLHPYSKEAKDVENHLWMQTSYAFIASYKERITFIDRAIQANARQQAQQDQPQSNQRHTSHGPVEYRKLLQRFRQFLAEEEKFWIQLVLRIYRSFALKEVQPILTTLGLITETSDPIAPSGLNDEAREANPPGNGRNAFPEEQSVPLAPSSGAERDSRIAILSKALICLGDIARYRELYNEAGGRPRAGHEDGAPARRGKIRRKGAAGLDHIPLARNYDKAQQRYEQARLLVPYDGNPSHQLAILATYRRDSFSSLVHYYRALCVRQPYETAAENLGTVLNKALEQWSRSRKEKERGPPPSGMEVRDRIQLFKDQSVVLHAFWRKGIERKDSKIREHDKNVYQNFYQLVSERQLPIDMISNTIIMSEGALWKHRMIRDSHGPGRRPEAQLTPESSAILEWRIFHHLMDMHFALLEVGRNELKDLPSMENVDNDLAQRISATFRRTLPALRIASKWLRANFTYVMDDLEFKAYQQKEKLRGVEVSSKSSPNISGHSVHTIRFWKGYAQFVSALSQAFPGGRLPSLTTPLEEDIDMRGFLPLKRLMGDTKGATDSPSVVQTRERVHPNEEQLMRISDLLSDAQAIVKMENSPLVLVGSSILFNDQSVQRRSDSLSGMKKIHDNGQVESPVHQQQIMNIIRDTSLKRQQSRDREDDALTELTSRTDDEVLRDAFEHIDRQEVEDDDEDDEIVWDPKASFSPALSPIMQTTPITPIRPLAGPSPNVKMLPSPPHATLSPQLQVGKTPIGSPRAQIISATTAQDLLLDVMNAGRKPLGGLAPPSDPSGVQPTLLFGAELAHRPNTHSIWSAARDEQPLKFGGPTAAPGYHGFQSSPRVHSHSLSASQDLNSSSFWAAAQATSTQNPQHHLGGGGLAMSPGSFVLPPQPNVAGSVHHHVPSASGSLSSHLSPYYGNLSPGQADHVVHPSAPIQQAFQRPSNPPLSYFQTATHSSNVYHDGGASAQAYNHSQYPSLQESRVGHPFMTSPIQQMWGNNG